MTTEMYCAIVDDKTGKVCGNVDKSFTAYCIKHCRSPHRIREIKELGDKK